MPQEIQKKLPVKIQIVQVSAAESARLNRWYRKKHTPANVLSFFYGKEYGEIIVCPSVIRREAKAEKHSFEYQMTWMIVHGMIHLAGLHHEQSAAAAKKTEALERKILATIFNEPQHHHLS